LLVVPVLALALAGGGCKNRKKGGTISELSPPKGAPAWESRFGVAFDDSYTPTDINLQGRAPNDVLDQQLFQARLGHAAVVLLVKVEQVWGKGRYQGRQDQFVEVEVGEELLGSLPKDAPERLMIEVDSTDELPGTLKGEIMLLFLRWDAESEPPYHHHLMPADEDVVALIKAMVKHAQEEGVLNNKGDETKRGGKRKRRGRKNKRRKKAERSEEPADDGAGSSSGGTPIGVPGPVPGGGSDAPDEPPPANGPQPDESTGLQDLGGDPEPEPEPEPESEPEAGGGEGGGSGS
jgi:hypothetical protein